MDLASTQDSAKGDGKCRCCLTISQWLRIRVCLVTTLAVCIMVSGVFEAYELELRSSALLRASSDPTCYVHLFPYDQDDVELLFELGTSKNFEQKSANSSAAKALAVYTGQALNLTLGKLQMLKPQECSLVITTDNDSNIQFHRSVVASSSTSTSNSSCFQTSLVAATSCLATGRRWMPRL